ncbi:MAG TPA: monofunctional biosynthetic peptidoglycan transglycosylase [Azospirillaceae bacterium]|nr:monofunctional biosynthetic peptidoglycan transglycosylase [Azospirillaceae bacterium]
MTARPRRIVRSLARLAFGIVLACVVWVLLYRTVPPPATALMLARAAQGAGIAKDWVALEEISPNLIHAVIASEDSLFCRHSGFDWNAIQEALEDNGDDGPMRGGSTISQQTAKNAFLWPDRTWLRKGLEAGFTVLIETLWPKRRILEVYLNIAEWGDGVYGAQAAALAHFGKSAALLTRREAALLAVSLPAPRRRDPARPSTYHARRAGVIEQRMAVVARDGLAGCM